MKVAMLVPDEAFEKGIAFYSKDLIKSMNEDGLTVEKVIYTPGNIASLMKSLRELKKYDLIHIQHENSLFGRLGGLGFLPFIFLLGLSKKGKILITFHVIHKKQEKKFSKNKFFEVITRKIVWPLTYNLSRFFVGSFIVHANFLKEDLVEESRIRKDQIEVIYQGIKKRTMPSEEIAKKNLKLKGKTYLLIGNINVSKGFDIILNNAKEIPGEILIAGDKDYGVNQEYLNSLKEKVKSEKIENIRFDMRENLNSNSPLWWEYFSAADLVLLPYRSMATSGIFTNAIEAKKPVIGGNLKYLHEVFSKYKCVGIANQEEDYADVIRDSIQRKNYQNLKKGIIRFSKDNSLSEIAKKHIALYGKIFSKL